MDAKTIIVLEGDETGQELLEEALRVLAPEATGLELDFPRFDLSLGSRQATKKSWNACSWPARRSCKQSWTPPVSVFVREPVSPMKLSGRKSRRRTPAEAKSEMACGKTVEQ